MTHIKTIPIGITDVLHFSKSIGVYMGFMKKFVLDDERKSNYINHGFHNFLDVYCLFPK